MRTLQQLLQDRKEWKQFTLFYDIETFQYNEEAGRKRPSDYKNMIFSFAVSWIDEGIVELERFPTVKSFFDIIISEYKDVKKKPRITLNAHNTNKYDNHFVLHDLLYYYPHMRLEDYYLLTATTNEGNKNALKIKDLSKKDKDGIILEKRIKSRINVELLIFLYGIQFETVDNWVKTNVSLKTLGNKLKRLGVVTDAELKTDFDYTKHNRADDLTDEEARDYALSIFNSLSPNELTYIDNDVILLAKSVYYYSDLFNGFDYSKKTFTSNILAAYNTNDLTSFQLLNRIGSGKEKTEVRYTDYKFANQNLYDYLKPFYRGGLNFYNQFYVGKIITSGVFSMDLRSSYPYSMHHFKIPTFLSDYEAFEKESEIPISYSDDTYTLFQLNKETFDALILNNISSILLKQILVKYYNTTDTININSYTFRLIETLTGIRFESIPVLSYITFETEYFGSRDQIEAFYKIKTQGKEKEKLIFNSPYDITRTIEPNDTVYTSEEVDNSKVSLNGLYGIPALRPFFNLFRKAKNGYVNVENGHKNAERNIVFSIFITSVSLFNLLEPLQYLTQEEIDENFLYCDTDSLYLKKEVQHKIPPSLFPEFKLGAWDLEHDTISHFYILNHKKYAYIDPDETDKDGTPKGIQVRSGGIPHDSFKRDMDFETFIDTQFSHGVEINTLKSIYNNQGTISLYPSVTALEVGKGYRIKTVSPYFDKLKKQMLEEIKEQEDAFDDDVLYIESELGTFSLSDLYPFTHQVDKKEDMVFLEIAHEKIKKQMTV